MESTQKDKFKLEKLEIVYPGKILKQYFMEPLKITGDKLSREICVSQITISNIVNNKRAISTDVALRLSKYFNNTPEFWLNLQQRYEIELQKEKAQEILNRITPFTDCTAGTAGKPRQRTTSKRKMAASA